MSLEILLVFSTSALLLGFGGPWWTIAIPAVVLGVVSQKNLLKTMGVSLMGPLAWIVLAFLHDAHADYRIGRRLAGVFELAWAPLIYVIIFLFASLVALTGVAAGFFIRAGTRDLKDLSGS